MIKKKYVFSGLLLFLILICGAVMTLRRQAVNIVYMTDSKYLPYMMVSLNSAILNKNKTTKYHFHVITKDITTAEVQQLKNMRQNNVAIDVYPARELNLNYAHLGRFASFRITMQKLFIAEYLPNLDKVLYLDADTLVQKDLKKVYQTNLSAKYAAAVKDGLMYQAPEHIEELHLKNPNFYFNSGVMLLNLSAIRKNGVIHRAIRYFNTHNEVFGDQDVLNYVFSGHVLPLSFRYNCNKTFFEEKSADFLADFWQEPVAANPQKVYENAAILHFAGHKPWTEFFSHPYLKPLWWHYAEQTKAKYHIAF